jgi:hypothetical protein
MSLQGPEDCRYAGHDAHVIAIALKVGFKGFAKMFISCQDEDLVVMSIGHEALPVGLL